MHNSLTVVLLVAVAVLGYLVHGQSDALSIQDRQIKELSGAMEAKATTAKLDLQAQCAKQARIEYDENGWKKEQFAVFTNHYNEKMNRCFILVQNTSAAQPRDGTFFTTRILSDAFEGKVYGEYNWRSDKVKKYWEVPPFDCKGTLPSGEEKICHSSDEFDEIVKMYMQ